MARLWAWGVSRSRSMWFLARTRAVRRHLRTIERAAGALLVVAGVLLLSGRFTVLSSFFAGFGQLITLE